MLDGDGRVSFKPDRLSSVGTQFVPWFIEDIGGCFAVNASNDRPLVFIYYVLRGRFRPPIPREAIDPQCRATDRRRHCQAARAIAEDLIYLTKIKVLPSPVIKLVQRELSVKFTVIQSCNAHGTLN
jgi:hypothetical protein